jgi:membrane-bound inhibitor of C-type lysozyme
VKVNRLFPLVALALSACASTPSSGPWIHWVCDTQAELHWRHVGSEHLQVEVRLDGGEHVYLLEKQPSGSGVLYTDGELAFHLKANQGLIYWAQTDELIGRNCK